MLNAAGLEPNHQLSFIENRQVSVTAEKVAINAVMAGCKAEYMPVIAATVEALADPLYGYHGPATSTGCTRWTRRSLRLQAPARPHYCTRTPRAQTASTRSQWTRLA